MWAVVHAGSLYVISTISMLATLNWKETPNGERFIVSLGLRQDVPHFQINVSENEEHHDPCDTEAKKSPINRELRRMEADKSDKDSLVWKQACSDKLRS